MRVSAVPMSGRRANSCRSPARTFEIRESVQGIEQVLALVRVGLGA
jgi:hypothetical protein